METGYIIIGVLWPISLILTYLLSKPSKKKKSKSIDSPTTTEPTVSTLKSSAPVSTIKDVVKVEGIVNKWTLQIDGTAKFDVLVEWTDGSAHIYSGQAPMVYDIHKPIGILPASVAGIPPEWADDGISYSWSLNEIHWS